MILHLPNIASRSILICISVCTCLSNRSSFYPFCTGGLRRRRGGRRRRGRMSFLMAAIEEDGNRDKSSYDSYNEDKAEDFIPE